ncbi:MAG TPA: efflux RND transporter periplasmic adaptor subunit [Kiritimatiellia bacterium]|nr:efflux RND transporter periplasmic adaptor subunit [Kiritimatiellia bacterium]HMO99040.1 efflux RND transporter periplasmic adaptor subunit [Kiritimatiellia bacterium]HMP96116.1 efflux RND transporter periplasmic adaptor subunit [Kiritimatiellia bacterium]
MKNKKAVFVVLLVGLIVGYWLGALRSSHDNQETDAEGAAIASEYTCSMHPQIRQPKPGLCPLCAMDLIPVGSAGPDAGPRAIALSPAARKLARIETSPVTLGPVEVDVALSGVLAYDTTRGRDVVVLAEGQIRILYANVLGMRVRAGDPLAEVYSPDVFAAARDLVVAGQNRPLADAARRKLLLFGVEEAEIASIAASGQAPETYTVRSPVDGVVVSVSGHQGHWLMRGDDLVEIYDTSVVWALLDVYEQDIGWLAFGQQVNMQVEAFPDDTIEGTVAFIPADVDPMTRTVKIRVDVPNPDNRLKPGMFARGVVSVKKPEPVLSVPATAVLKTGKRAMVYVQSPDDPAVFEGQVIVPGHRAGDRYVVAEGLEEGERVVTRGAMRIDSSMQLLAKPSMMSLPSEGGGVAMRPQTLCPIAGGKIDHNDYVDYGGYRIYFCCPGCDEEFLKDPDKHLRRMRAEGIEPERAPVAGGGHDHHK